MPIYHFVHQLYLKLDEKYRFIAEQQQAILSTEPAIFTKLEFPWDFDWGVQNSLLKVVHEQKHSEGKQYYGHSWSSEW